MLSSVRRLPALSLLLTLICVGFEQASCCCPKAYPPLSHGISQLRFPWMSSSISDLVIVDSWFGFALLAILQCRPMVTKVENFVHDPGLLACLLPPWNLLVRGEKHFFHVTWEGLHVTVNQDSEFTSNLDLKELDNLWVSYLIEVQAHSKIKDAELQLQARVCQDKVVVTIDIRALVFTFMMLDLERLGSKIKSIWLWIELSGKCQVESLNLFFS